MSAIMVSISSVAFGRMSGSCTPAARISSMNRRVYSSATSAAVRSSSPARLMILSSTSVTFCTKVTSKPRQLR